MGNPRCYHPDSVNNGVVANNDIRPAFSWASAGNQALPQWVQLQWPYTIETNHVDVHTMQNYKVQDFTVEYWDGSNWQVAASVQGNQDVSRGVDFPAVQTNAIRIVGTKGSIGEPNIIRINEITVQGRRLDVAWVTYIRPLNSQKCLDISGVSLAAGADAHQWDCHGGQNQQFAFYPVVGQPGTYNVIAVHSGKCLEVTSGSYADGAIVQQADCNGGNNQKFRLTSVPALGSLQDFQITVAHSNKCLDVTNNQTTNGTLIQQFSCHSLIGTPTTFNQIWHLQNKP
jgi:VCBS repeat-containing protein